MTEQDWQALANRLIAAANEKDAEIARLRTALDAVLLFHGGGGWTAVQHDEWVRLTDRSDATTKALCDTARAALGKS